jgi:hypothetical protein
MPEYINNENFGSFIKYPNRIRVLLTKKIIFFSLVFFFNIYDSRPDNCVAIKNGTWSSDIIKFGIRSSYKTATLQFSITGSYVIKSIFHLDRWSPSKSLSTLMTRGQNIYNPEMVFCLRYGLPQWFQNLRLGSRARRKPMKKRSIHGSM